MGKLPSFDEMQAQSDIPDWAKDQPANKGTSKDDWRPVGHGDWQQFPEAPSASKGELPDAPWAEFQRADQAKPPFDPNKPYEAWPERRAMRRENCRMLTLGWERRAIRGRSHPAPKPPCKVRSPARLRVGVPSSKDCPERQACLNTAACTAMAFASRSALRGSRGSMRRTAWSGDRAIRSGEQRHPPAPGKTRGEHPWVYGGGELAGAVVPMLMPEATGPGLAARMALRSAPAMAQPAVHPKVSKKRARAERSGRWPGCRRRRPRRCRR